MPSIVLHFVFRKKRSNLNDSLLSKFSNVIQRQFKLSVNRERRY